MATPRPSQTASHSAVLVCQARAAAHERVAPGRFADPTAWAMLREEERELVRQVRAEAPPAGWRRRIQYEIVRGSTEILVPRTIAIDDAVREGPRAQVVILGAGLDGRAWRMTELRDSETYEVDHPASQRDKRERAAALGDRQPHFVPVDFARDDLVATLEAAGHHAAADPAEATHPRRADRPATAGMTAAQRARTGRPPPSRAPSTEGAGGTIRRRRARSAAAEP